MIDVDTFDELRIIAQDARGLEPVDRAKIREAADELENAYKMLVSAQSALIECQQRRIATNDRLIAARHELGILRFYAPEAWRVKWKFQP